MESGTKTKVQGGNPVRGVWASGGAARVGLPTWAGCLRGTLSLPKNPKNHNEQKGGWHTRQVTHGCLLTRQEGAVGGTPAGEQDTRL